MGYDVPSFYISPYMNEYIANAPTMELVVKLGDIGAHYKSLRLPSMQQLNTMGRFALVALLIVSVNEYPEIIGRFV